MSKNDITLLNLMVDAMEKSSKEYDLETRNRIRAKLDANRAKAPAAPFILDDKLTSSFDKFYDTHGADAALSKIKTLPAVQQKLYAQRFKDLRAGRQQQAAVAKEKAFRERQSGLSYVGETIMDTIKDPNKLLDSAARGRAVDTITNKFTPSIFKGEGETISNYKQFGNTLFDKLKNVFSSGADAYTPTESTTGI